MGARIRLTQMDSHIGHPLKILVLFPFALLYLLIIWIRNFLFDQKLLKSFDAGVKVVSVGNLSTGGTGKTPLIHHLVGEALKLGKKPAILSRGYGRSGLGVERVDPHAANGPERFGDEPVWLAREYQAVPVYVGADRVRAIQEILKKEKVDLVFLDDGFQHRWLSRSVDWVLIDVSAPKAWLLPLPIGRAREGLGAIQRAHGVFFTKANLGGDGPGLSYFRERLPPGVPSAEVSFVISEFQELRTQKKRTRADTQTSVEKALVVSGLGNPAAFEESVRRSCIFEVVQSLSFEDHHFYSEKDGRRIQDVARSLGVSNIIVSEKDAVKLGGIIGDSSLKVWQSRLSLEIHGPLKEFYDRLS